MVRNLDIALLRTFLAVSDHKSMTAASRLLHLTQGAVSQQIARLEAQAGPLFLREHRDVRLTAGGERLLGPVRHLLSVHDALWDEIHGGAVDGPVRLGAPQDLVASSLGAVLSDFAEACPRAELTLVCASSTELLRALGRGDIDLALLEELPGTSTGDSVAAERLVWVGARGGNAWRKTPLPVSLVDESCAFRPVVLDALRRQGRPWRTMFENGSIDATTATVRADLAVTVLLASTVPAGLETLAPGPDLPQLPVFALTLHTAAGHPSPAATALAGIIRERYGRAAGAASAGTGPGGS